MPIGAQLRTLTSRLALAIDDMPQIELALATVLGAELDVLLSPRIVHAQFVISRRTQHVAFVIAQGHMVRVLTVV
ncbi:hypothetical protein D3C85_825630 [compost metagenome]